ncbi:MAG: glycosyltransferase [Bryocella sp.]
MTIRSTGRITASLVTYKHSCESLLPLIDSLATDPQIAAWVVVDNGATHDLDLAQELQECVEARGGLFIADANHGFGAGHDQGFEALRKVDADFHLFINPDISFSEDVLGKLVEVLDAHPEIGRVMPRVVYPDGRLQRLNKLLPTPFDLFGRRFLPGALREFVYSRFSNHELRGSYDIVFPNVPFLSGCFILARRAVFEQAGGFDKRYFMYLEDCDLSRSMQQICGNLYWPHVTIAHGHARGAHKNLKLTLVALKSSVLYFNKWGWFFDAKRSRINREAVKRYRELTGPAAKK